MSTITIQDKTVTAWVIVGAKALDPITYIAENHRPGAGTMTITCYGRAWTGYWGAMGDENTVESFFSKADTGYLVGKMLPDSPRHKKTDIAYFERIVAAVQQAIKACRMEAVS